MPTRRNQESHFLGGGVNLLVYCGRGVLKIIVIMLHVLDRLLPIDKRTADRNRVSQNNLAQLTVPLPCK